MAGLFQNDRHFRFISLVLLMILMAASQSAGQSGVPFNQRDDEYRLLGLKRARSAFDAARAELKRIEALAEQELIARREVENARRTYDDAEVNYQQSLLAVLFEMQYVTVSGAVKYQDEQDRKRVKLTLSNASGGNAEYQRLIGMEDELFRALQPDIVNNVYVSLLNDDGAIISQPYETKITQLRYNKPAQLDFLLLQDVDAVTVNLVYGNGTTRSPKIYLQKDASVNKVVVQAQQFSQEVELGGSSVFDLTLELFSGESTNYKLEVVNLPRQINRYFTDAGGQTRLSQFRFTESTNTRRAGLNVFLPDRPTDEIDMDKVISFYVLVIPREQRAEMGKLQERMWSEEEIAKLNVGYVRLEIVPRGSGRLLVKAPQLYHAIDPGEPLTLTLDVKNEGTRRLDNIELEIDPPLNWQYQVTPKIVSTLEIGEQQPVEVQITPAPATTVGKYELRVRTTSFSDNQPIAAEDKTYTIEVLPQTNVLLTLVIVLLILGLVSGLVIFGVRLSKK